MESIDDKIMKRIVAHGKGKWVCTSKDFLDLGSRKAVDQALFRQVKSGELRRVGRDLYDMPRWSKLLNDLASPDFYSAIEAVRRRDGVQLMHDGLEAANLIGLNPDVAARAMYVTDGKTRIENIAGLTVEFKHADPSVIKWAGRSSSLVVQALHWLGPTTVTCNRDRFASHLKRTLPDDVKQDLSENRSDLPEWMLPLIYDITTI